MTTPPDRRTLCTACLRPVSACICGSVITVHTDIDVLILQHPLEVMHAKNSGRLLHLCLPGSRMMVGEWFDAEVLAGALPPDRHNLLLYPQVPDTVLAQVSVLPASPGAGLRLVVLDATWRKSRKMLHLNPLLQQLPRLSLDDMPPSRYRLRRAHKPGQLSTLEATCAALAQLERGKAGQGGDEKFALLLQAFDGFIAGQAARMPVLPVQSPRSTSPARRTPSGAS